jgi:hypothetical protein
LIYEDIMQNYSTTAVHKRRNLALAVLEKIGGSIVDLATGAEAFLAAGYGASYGRIKRKGQWIERRRKMEVAARGADVKRITRYYDLLYRLRKDGLVRQSRKNGTIFLKLTDAGKDKLAALLSSAKEQLPVAHYATDPSQTYTIVAFDIPERDRRKRNWLRRALSAIGFRMVQKSVSIGKVKIPREFLNDIGDLNLQEYVEIFEITKAGSLRHIV